MRGLLAVSVLAVLVSGLRADPEPVRPVFKYHQDVGFPEAKRIKEAEDQYHRDSLLNRIVGGVIAPANAHPYLGGLVVNIIGAAGDSVCGSSLISANRLVTAAHCWFDGWNQAWQLTVVLGSQFLFSGGTRVATSTVVLHPQWTPSTLENDVAMIYLPTSVWFSQSIMPVSLPPTTQLWDTFEGHWVTAAGYGKTSDALGVTTATQVSQVTVQVISVAQCILSFTSTFVKQSTLCTNGAGGIGICGGDSGGPLVMIQNGEPILVGISSFVASTGCQLGHPSGFARVTSYQSFILQHML